MGGGGGGWVIASYGPESNTPPTETRSSTGEGLGLA